MFKSLCAYMLSFSLSKFLGIEWLGHIVGFTFEVSNVAVSCYIPTSKVREFQLFHIYSNSSTAILTGVELEVHF